MKKLRKFINVGYLTLMIVFSNIKTFSQLPNFDPLYDSVFVEEFNSSSLNTSEWRLQYNWGTFYNSNIAVDGGGPILCFGDTVDVASLNMSPTDTNNRVISGGTCKLKLKKENHQGTVWTFPSPCNSSACANQWCLNPNDSANSACFVPVQIPFKYSNSMLMTSKLFKYGYFIIKFRIQGWTASAYNAYMTNFWMYNGNASTVPWSEIDIFEIRGNNGRLANNIHVNNIPYSTGGASWDGIIGTEPSINLSQWHTASVHWTPDFIDFYIDGVFNRRSTNSLNQSLLEMPLIIETAIPQFFECILPDPVNTTFPVVYEIDYVKAYQPVLACDTNKTYCNVTASTFKSKLYKSLTIGGSGCSASFNNSKATAVASDYVLLNEGFEVGSNMEMTIKTEPCWSSMKLQQRSSDFKQLPPSNFAENFINSRPNPN